MSDGKKEAIDQLKRQFWDTMARADALRNVAATLRSEEQGVRFIQRAETEEKKAKEFLRQAESFAKSDPPSCPPTK